MTTTPATARRAAAALETAAVAVMGMAMVLGAELRLKARLEVGLELGNDAVVAAVVQSLLLL